MNENMDAALWKFQIFQDILDGPVTKTLCSQSRDPWLRSLIREIDPACCSYDLAMLLCFIAQSCLTLCDPMDCSSPGSSAHGILQARVWEWVAISFSRGSSRHRDWTWISCTAGRFFTISATREAHYLVTISLALPQMRRMWCNLPMYFVLWLI